MMKPQEQFMQAAIEEAINARNAGDYSIGAVIVKNDEIIVRGTNRARIDRDSTQHAEVVVIKEASKLAGSRFLPGCVLYTTHEPCPMCASAAIWARMDGIVFGSTLQDMIDYCGRNGNREWTWRTINITAAEIIAKGEPKLELIEGFMRSECKKLFHSS